MFIFDHSQFTFHADDSACTSSPRSSYNEHKRQVTKIVNEYDYEIPKSQTTSEPLPKNEVQPKP